LTKLGGKGGPGQKKDLVRKGHLKGTRKKRGANEPNWEEAHFMEANRKKKEMG